MDREPGEFIADLHIHSRFSRACSRSLRPATIAVWAQLKGLSVVGTGDLTHPEWLEELEESLEEAENGLLKLKPGLEREVEKHVPPACRREIRFMLTGEVSTIYKSGGRTRKLHHVIFVPDFDSAHRFSENLARLGNVTSDGRPILGLDSRKILELVLELGNESFLVPAHIWTPWFSLLGHKSGFDSLEECFGELSGEIFAVETGLSSDPPMNWRLSSLDRYTLISNSDAHSPRKLARECNVFRTEMSFRAVREALETGKKFGGTIEFFPEEGKYHYDGHRACGTRLSPEETRRLDGLCPVCGRKVTVGVMHRVEELADRPAGARRRGADDFVRLVPLEEILSEALGRGTGTRTVDRAYFALLSRLGPELEILRRIPREAIEEAAGPSVAEAIWRVRAGEVEIAAGFDGEFGKVRVLSRDEREGEFIQMSLF